jgi:nitronate monooxygenase
VDAGQGVGMIRDDATVAEVIHEMCTDAQALLAGWSG